MQRISTSSIINAAARRVWDILVDFRAYGEWNPLIRQISGDISPGSRLRVTLRPEGGRAMSFTPVVLACDPTRELRWKGKLLVNGLFDGEHAFKLTASASGSCTFT